MLPFCNDLNFFSISCYLIGRRGYHLVQNVQFSFISQFYLAICEFYDIHNRPFDQRIRVLFILIYF